MFCTVFRAQNRKRKEPSGCPVWNSLAARCVIKVRYEKKDVPQKRDDIWRNKQSMIISHWVSWWLCPRAIIQPKGFQFFFSAGTCYKIWYIINQIHDDTWYRIDTTCKMHNVHVVWIKSLVRSTCTCKNTVNISYGWNSAPTGARNLINLQG